ncbi:MAG: Hsp70 family protein [Synergistaceae bacterium]|nr:Hsp70 family protein [Synergistaceae bacterium]
MSEKVFGIDLGTTYSAAATLDENGKPQIMEFYSESDRVMPSAVYFQPGGAPVVGKDAKAMAESEPENVIQFVKRSIGKENVKFTFNGMEYDPISVSSLILKRIKEDLEEQGHNVSDVVITCPAYFGNEERMATKQAGAIAGLNVLNIINEPTAAALNYCSKEFGEPRKIMVYDLGGGTFDVTLLDFSVDELGNNAKVKVIDSKGDDRLGGIDWDDRLYQHIIGKYSDENGTSPDDIDDITKSKIHSQVEDTKKKLSKVASMGIMVDGDRIEVTAGDFENVTSDLVDRTMSFVHQLLADNNMSPDDVDTVLLVGGSSRMPMIQNAVKNIFPENSSGSRRVRVEEPDYAVAKGAAIAAGLIIDEAREEKETPPTSVDPGETPSTPSKPKNVQTGGLTFVDTLSRSFGPAVWVVDNDGEQRYMINNLLFIGDESPASAEETYQTMADGQEYVEIAIFENTGKDKTEHAYVVPSVDSDGNEQASDPALNVKKIGELTLDLPAGTPKGSPIKVRFESSETGLTIYAENVKTGQSISTSIENTGTLKSEEELIKDTKHLASFKTMGNI